MKYYNRKTDALMMPSTFRWNAKLALNDREREIMKYAPLVMKVVNGYNREEGRIGVFDKHDLIQSGFVGVIEAYDRIVRDEKNKVNVNYIERNVKGTIDRYLNYQAKGIAIPEYQLQKTKAEIMADRIVSAFYFTFRLDDKSISGKTYAEFSSRIEYDQAQDSYRNEELSQLLSDAMLGLSEKERTIINMNYGITMEKVGMKYIANHLNMSEIGVKVAKKRALEKMKTLGNAIILQSFL